MDELIKALEEISRDMSESERACREYGEFSAAGMINFQRLKLDVIIKNLKGASLNPKTPDGFEGDPYDPQ